MSDITGIAVTIPVGPWPVHRRWLDECLDSIRAQTFSPVDILLVDDMAGLDPADYPDCRIWRAPFRLSIPAVDNVGVALAGSELVYMVSCDDKLMPDCLERCWETWQKQQDPLGFYWVTLEYSTGERQALPCGRAMVTKTLWRHVGGFPPESAVGACDHILLNMLLQHPEAGKLYHVQSKQPLYWHRTHPEQYTQNVNCHPPTIADIRDVFEKRWQPTQWGRMEP
jgi:hypothetical protein